MQIGDIENRFTYHAPQDPEQAARYRRIREEALRFALLIDALAPD